MHPYVLYTVRAYHMHEFFEKRGTGKDEETHLSSSFTDQNLRSFFGNPFLAWD